MAPPNRDRVRVSMFLSRAGVEACIALAKERGVAVAEIYRAVFKAGYPIVEKDSRRGTSDYLLQPLGHL